MKTRNGFVSNSSTSSFVLIMTKEAYKNALAESDLDETGKEMIDKLWAKKGYKLVGQGFVCFSDITNIGGYSTMWSPEYNDKLTAYNDYVDEKWDGDFSAVFLSGFANKIKDKDKIEINDSL